MPADELNGLIPKNKMETDKAEQLVALGYPAVAPVLADMIFWSLNVNDPVAHVFIPFLETLDRELIPALSSLLTDPVFDTRGKAMVLADFIRSRDQSIAQGLKDELIMLANTQPEGYTKGPARSSYVSIYALLILAKNKLIEPNWLQERLEEKEDELKYKNKLLEEVRQFIIK